MKAKVTSEQSPRYAYAITLGFGILAFVVSIKSTSVDLKSILRLAAIYLFFGIVVGLLWPMGSWKWGLWLSTPFFFIIGLSVLFTGPGPVGVFLQKDLPVLITIVITGCLGGLVGSRLRGFGQREQNTGNGNTDE